MRNSPFRRILVAVLSLTLVGLTVAHAAPRRFTTRRGTTGRGPAMEQGTQATPIGRYAGRPTGALHEMAKHGLIVISPGAPLQLGSGARMVTTNPFPGSLAQDQANERRRPYGGIKVIGWEF